MKISRGNIASIIFHLILLFIIFSSKNPKLLTPSLSDGVTVTLISDDQLNQVKIDSKQEITQVNPITPTPAEINLKDTHPIIKPKQETPKQIKQNQKLATQTPITHNEHHKPINKPIKNKKIQNAQQINDILNQIPTNKPAGRSKYKALGGTASGTSNNNNSQLNNYADKVINLIRPYIIIPENINDGATAIVKVTLLPNLKVYNINLIKSSGNPDYDENIQQAISNAGAFPPLPTNANFNDYRVLILTFKPD